MNTKPWIALCVAVLVHATAVASDELASLQAIAAGSEVNSSLSGLQVSLLKNGELAEGYALGFAQILENRKEPLRRDHKVRIASISKLVVAIGVMQLVDAGKLDLDRNVSDYLGWTLRNPFFAQDAITARQLLSHTSSIRDGSAYFIAAGTGEVRDFFTPGTEYWEDGKHFAKDTAQAPGEFFTYSNLNFGILGTLIEKLSGQRFDQYMAQQVLIPLGLSARFDPCEIPPHQRAAGFRKGRKPGGWSAGSDWLAQVDGAEPSCFYGRRNADFAEEFLGSYSLGSNATIYSPQGGLRASADDLLVILQMFVNRGTANGHRLLSEDAVDAMLAPQWTLNAERSNGLSAGEAEPGGPTDGLMTSYGLSVHRINTREWDIAQGPELLLGHLGEAYGVLSHALIDLNTGDGIATIITGTAKNPADSPPGTTPLYRVEEEILRWWLEGNH